MPQLVRHHLLFVALAAIVFFCNLGGPRLWDRDESLNARCTVEMMERGDWVVPYFNGDVRFMKPAAMYWFMMGAVSVFGPTEFAFRFWSAVAGVGTVVVTYHIGRRLFHPEVGLWGAVILATSLMFAVLSRAVKVDALLILFGTLALLIFVLAVFRPKNAADKEVASPKLRWPGHYYPQSTLVVIAMFALMGAAALGKGPVGLVLPTAVIGMFLLVVRLPIAMEKSGGNWPEPALQWQFEPMALIACWLVFSLLVLKVSPDLGLVVLFVLGFHLFFRHLPIFRPFAPQHFFATCWYMRPITALVAAAVVAVPWHVWVAARDIDWITGFYWVSSFSRAASPLEGHGGSGVFYYPIAIAVGFVPWSMFLGPVLIGWVKRIWRDDPWRVGYMLLACWFGVYVVVFSIAGTKLPNYVVPAYPALALATGCYLYHLRRSATVAAAWWPQVAMAALAFTGIAFLIGLPIAAHIFLPGEEWLGLVGLIPVATAVACFLLFRRGQTRAAVVSFAASGTVLVIVLLAGVAQQVDRHQQIHVLIGQIDARSEDPEIAAFACLEPTWVFYSGRNIKALANTNRKRIPDYLSAKRDRFLITTDDGYRQLKDQLSSDIGVLAQTPFFLREGDLVVLGHAEQAENVASISRPPRQSR